MGDVITREYLVDRYVDIPSSWLAGLAQRATYRAGDTATVCTLEEFYEKAIRAEEDRQIREGIRGTLERNMEHHRENCARDLCSPLTAA